MSPVWGKARDTVLAALLLVLLLLLLSVDDARLAILGGSLLLTVLRFWAASAFLKPPGALRSWRLFGVALLAWAGADLTIFLTWAIQFQPAEAPSLVDLFRLVGYFAALLAVFGYPRFTAEKLGRLRDWMDLAILGTAVVALAWLSYIRPMLIGQLANPAAVYWRTLHPVFGLLLVATVARLALKGGSPGMGWLLLGFSVVAASDLVAGYLSIRQTYHWGTFAELGPGIASLCFLLAARRSPTAASRQLGGSRAERRVSLLAIGLAGLVAGLVVVDWLQAGRPDWTSVIAVVLMTAIFVARQGVLAGQMEMRLYAALVNHAADMAFICDRSGLFVLVNPAFSRMVAADAGQRLQDVIESQLTSAVMLEEGARDGWSGEVHLRQPDGSRLAVDLALRPVFDERREDPLLAGTAHDLSVIKAREGELRQTLLQLNHARAALENLNRQLEAKVEQRTSQLAETIANLEQVNQRLQELDELKSEFVTLVSHELRAPLTNIKGGLEVILQRRSLPSSASHALRLVQHETERLAGFVESILDLSVLEAGRTPFEIKDLDLNQLMVEVIQRFSSTVQPQPKIRRRRSRKPLRVRADQSALKSALFHLLDNAAKYAPHGEIAVRALQQDGMARLEVRDQGAGIAPQARELVFEKFQRLALRDDQEVYGYGLGLYMSRKLLRALEGDLFIEDHPAGGGCFVIQLPLAGEG